MEGSSERMPLSITLKNLLHPTSFLFLPPFCYYININFFLSFANAKSLRPCWVNSQLVSLGFLLVGVKQHALFFPSRVERHNFLTHPFPLEFTFQSVILWQQPRDITHKNRDTWTLMGEDGLTCQCVHSVGCTR